MNSSFSDIEYFFDNLKSNQNMEGYIREALAAYFLSAPPFDKQTSYERKQYRRALHKLAEIETNSVLQSTAIRRPLRYGDLTALLSATLGASALRFQQSGIILKHNVPEKAVCTAAEPRVIQIALVNLLHASGVNNTNTPIYANVTINDHSVLVTVTGEYPVNDTKSLSLIREVARLHKGSFAISDETVAFSLHRKLPCAIGMFAAPTINELLTNPLSSVNIGLA